MRNVITKAAIGIKTADLMDVLTNTCYVSHISTPPPAYLKTWLKTVCALQPVSFKKF